MTTTTTTCPAWCIGNHHLVAGLPAERIHLGAAVLDGPANTCLHREHDGPTHVYVRNNPMLLPAEARALAETLYVEADRADGMPPHPLRRLTVEQVEFIAGLIPEVDDVELICRILGALSSVGVYR